MASAFSNFGSVMSSSEPGKAGENAIKGVSSGLASQMASDWLGQYGNARVQLNSSGTGNADVLLPLAESESALLFAQLGVRHNGQRATNNSGIGVRGFTDDWTFGVNTFYDYDMTGKNSRLGVGGEAWTDYLKFSTNGYFRITDWHQSVLSDMEDYNERPANGFDVRAEAYLPSHPQLGGRLVYEKYFGKGVALGSGNTSPDDLGHSPSAITVGVNYTPIPLVTFDASHKKGRNVDNDFQLGINLNYRFGVPWIDQISKQTVGLMRSVAGSRYDIIDRNYDIVMQYQKQDLIHLSLPEQITAYAMEDISLTAKVASKYGVKNIVWHAPALLAAGGSITMSSVGTVLITLPAYQPSVSLNNYQVSATAYDVRGNKSNTATTTLLVERSLHNITLKHIGNHTTLADGLSTVAFEATVINTANNANQPITGMAVTLSSTLGTITPQTAATDSNGKVSGIVTTSIRSGSGTVSASLMNGNHDTKPVRFTADSSTVSIINGDLTVVRDKAIANGVATNSVKAIIKDANGNPVSDQAVSFYANNNAVIASSGITDADGSVIMTLTNTISTVVTVTASVNGSSQSVNVTFVTPANIASGNLKVVTDGAVANGTKTNSVKAIVTDGHNAPVSNQVVSFSVANGSGATIATQGTTGPDGSVTVMLTSIKAGVVTVTATINGSAQTVDVTFIADVSTAQIQTLTEVTALNSGIVANGSQTHRVQARVTDAQGNPLVNQTVTFAASSGATLVPSVVTVTDSDGYIPMALTSLRAGVITVTATLSGGSGNSKTVDVAFIADTSSARLETLTEVTAPNSGIVADGGQTHRVRARVTDAQGNPLLNQTVTFTASNGATLVNQAMTVTDSDGYLSMALTSTLAGTVTVTATLIGGSGNSKTVAVAFIADVSSARLETLTEITASNSGIVANGSQTHSVQARVTDAQGNPLVNQTVTFSAGNGATLVSQTVTVTDSDGYLSMALTSLRAGAIPVTATLIGGSGNSKTVAVAFIADTSSAHIATLTEITAANSGIVADGSQTHSVRAQVTDAQGNPLANQTVTFAASSGATLVNQTVTVTDSDGYIPMALTSIRAGAITVTASLSGSNSKTVAVAFIADTSSARITTLTEITAANNGIVADGSQTHRVQARVTDAQGNPLINQTVTFSAGNGATLVSQTVTVTDSDGYIPMALTSIRAGAITVTARLSGSNDKTVDVIFIADVTTAQIATLTEITASNNGIVADGSQVHSVRAQVTDANGNPLANQTVTFSADNGATLVSQTVTVTDSDGYIPMALTSIRARAITVTASLSGGNSKEVQVIFIADVTTAQIVTLSETTAPNSGIVADGSQTHTVRARVSDANGNPLANQTVTFTASNGATLVSQAVTVTDSDGYIPMALTSIRAGAVTVTASLSGSNDKTVAVTFIADVTTAQIATLTEITASNNGIVADGSQTHSVRAHVTDANGNPLVNQTVTFSAGNGATLVNQTVTVTDSDGYIPAALTSIRAGTITVTASLSGSNDKTVAVTFIADATTAQIVTLSETTAPNSGIMADGSQTHTVRARVSDANGNPLANQTVTFTASNGATLVPSVVVTDSDGYIPMALTSIRAGAITVTASLSGSNSKTVDVTFTADTSSARIAALTEITAANSGIVADGSQTHSVRARVTDAQGNPLANQTVTFSAGNGATLVNQTVTVTDSDGYIPAALTSIRAGAITVTASLSGGNSKEVEVIFIADVTTAQIATLTETTAPNSGIVADGSQTHSVRAQVTDANGNPLANQTVTFAADNGATLVNQTVTVTDSDGYIPMALTNIRAGAVNVTASLSGGNSKEVQVIFIADATTAQIVTLSETTAPNSGIVADGSQTHTVRAQVSDANGNPLANQAVTFSAGNGATLVPSVVMTDSDGYIPMALTNIRAGAVNVTASLSGGNSKEVEVIFIADVTTAQIVTLSETTAPNSGIVADGSQTHSVRARVSDANGNPLANQTVTFAAGNGATLVNQTVTVTNSDGYIPAALTSIRAGTITVTASLSGSNDKTVDVIFIADVTTAQIVTLSETTAPNSGIVADGSQTHSVRAQVTDANGNPLANHTVTFSASNGATLVPSVTVTDSDGYIPTALTSIRAGTITVTASLSGGNSKEVQVIFIADVTTAQIVTLSETTAPNSGIVADGSQTHSVRAQVTDANGNPLVNQTVTFAAGNGATLVNQTVTVTDSDGYIPTALTSIRAGAITVTASLSGSADKTVDVIFIADVTTAQISTLTETTALNSGIVADGNEIHTVRAQVTDANGNPLANQTVTFAADNGATLVNQAVTVTDSDGYIPTALTSIRAGTITVTASLSGSADKTVDVIFIADVSTAQIVTLTKITALNSDIVADGNEIHSVQALVTDVKGNPLANQTVIFTADNGATLISETVTDSDGYIRTDLTNTRAGAVNVTATLTGGSGNNMTVQVIFIADVSTAQIVTLSETTAPNSGIVADGSQTHSVRAQVSDANGNPLVNQTVTFVASSGATLVPSVVMTDSDGYIPTALTSIRAGTITVTASLSGGNSKEVEVTFIADVSTAQIATLTETTALNSGIVADGSQTHSVKAQVTDANDNPLVNQVVIFTVGNGATLVSSVMMTDSDGYIPAALTSIRAGEIAVIATLIGVSNDTKKIDVLFIADVNSAKVILEKSVDNQPADGVADAAIKVTVTDANNNPLPGQNITVVADNGAIISSNSNGTSGADGTFVITLKSSTIGNSTVTAALDNNSSAMVVMTFVAVPFEIRLTLTTGG
ncbi:Ig-like domain-containing protein [Yersinia sp. 2466 StPb PI]|uniref:Ig-like domain-containing protein n=1 Tax=Yersinia sp. 2466 StPb PI TaxID=3061648 RepID=UPI00355BA682